MMVPFRYPHVKPGLTVFVQTSFHVYSYSATRASLQASKKQWQRDVRIIKNENLNDFQLPSKAKNSLQEDRGLAGMSLGDRRELEEQIYKTFLGICASENIDHCHHEDIMFYSSILAKGDPDCIVTCSKEEMLANRGKMPHGGKTIDFIAGIDKYMKDKNENSKADVATVMDRLEHGCDAIEGRGSCDKRALPLAAIPVIMGLVKLAGIAAAGYITNMSERQSTK